MTLSEVGGSPSLRVIDLSPVSVEARSGVCTWATSLNVRLACQPHCATVDLSTVSDQRSTALGCSDVQFVQRKNRQYHLSTSGMLVLDVECAITGSSLIG